MVNDKPLLKSWWFRNQPIKTDGWPSGDSFPLEIVRFLEWGNFRPFCCGSNFTWAMKKICLGYLGDYTTQLNRDYLINHYKDPYETSNNFMESRVFFSWLVASHWWVWINGINVSLPKIRFSVQNVTKISHSYHPNNIFSIGKRSFFQP